MVDKRLQAAALKQKRILQKNTCFDAFKLESRPTQKQLEIMQDTAHRIVYVVAGNQSGKSTLGGRETSWYFQETHPYWERPNAKHCHHCKSTNFEAVAHEGGAEEEYRCHDCSKVWVSWGTEPLTLIVSGKVSKMVTELWEKKIQPFLPAGSYKIAKDGNSLSSVTHVTNGNKIIFLSHEKAIKSKDKIQSYVAHFVWIDEMPDHYLYIEEAIQRITSKLGRLICTFTPKTSNPQVRDMVESVDDRVGVKYKFGKLDNPINQSPEKQELILAELAGVSAAVRNCVLYGDWLDADESVFHFDRSLHCVSLDKYNTNMEHVLAYDPAASGKGGLVMAVRNEKGWHVNMASYTNGGKAYSDLIIDIDNKIAPFHITRKIYDTHETAFILEFNKLKKQPGVLKDTSNWVAIKKHGRKREMITNLQQAMLDGWLTFDPTLEDLFNEFTSAQWAEGRDDKIQGSQHYHLLDALQYLIDLLPRKSELKPHLTRDQKIMRAMTQAVATPPKKRTSRIGKRRRR